MSETVMPVQIHVTAFPFGLLISSPGIHMFINNLFIACEGAVQGDEGLPEDEEVGLYLFKLYFAQ
jgi:hypothetical protein